MASFRITIAKLGNDKEGFIDPTSFADYKNGVKYSLDDAGIAIKARANLRFQAISNALEGVTGSPLVNVSTPGADAYTAPSSISFTIASASTENSFLYINESGHEISGLDAIRSAISETLCRIIISGKITARALGTEPSALSSFVSIEKTGYAPVNTTLPLLKGGEREDDAIFVIPGKWNSPSGTVFTYEWFIDGIKIEHSGSTYTPIEIHKGRFISAVEVASNIFGVERVNTNEVYVRDSNPLPPTIVDLKDLNISNSSVKEESRPGEIIGDIVGKTEGSQLTLKDSANGLFAILNNRLVSSATIPSYKNGQSYSVIIREILGNALNSPKDTNVQVNVVSKTTDHLKNITLSAYNVEETAEQGTVIGNIRGLTSGSRYSLIDSSGGRFAISGNRIVRGPSDIFYQDGATQTFIIREYLDTAANSPRDTVISVNVISKNAVQLGKLTLNNYLIAENSPAGTVIGSFVGRTKDSILSLYNNDGGRFAISGNDLVAGTTNIDYEQNPTCNIIVRESHPLAYNSPIDNAFLITVSNVPEAVLPALTLSAYNVDELSSAGTVVGSIQNKNPNSTLSLTDGASGRFVLVGNNIVCGLTTLDYETGASHTITLQETWAEAINSPRNTVITINVNDIYEPILVPLTLSNNKIDENSPAGTEIGTLVGRHVGSTLTLKDNSDNRFAIVNDKIVTGETNLDYETNTKHSIVVEENIALSVNGPLETTLEIEVKNVPDYILPNLIMSATTVQENSPSGTLVGEITNRTEGSTITLLNTGGDRFSLDGDNIVVGTTPIDFEEGVSRSIVIREIYPEGINSPRDTTINITVINVLEVTLKSLTLNNTNVSEKGPSGVVVGQIGGKTPGSIVTLHNNDGGRFAISGNNIVTGTTSIDYDDGPLRTIIIRETHTDGVNSPNDTIVEIAVAEVSDIFLASLNLSNLNVTENSAPATLVGSITGATPGSSIVLSDDAGGQFVLSGTDIITGLMNIDFEQSATRNITIIETLAGAVNSPRQNVFEISVSNVLEVSLAPLVLSNNSIVENSSVGSLVGNLSGFNSRSTLTLIDNAGGKFSLNNGKILSAGALDFEAISSYNITVREVNNDSIEGYYDTTFNITITNVPEITLGTLTLSANAVTENSAPNTIVGAVLGATSGSTITLLNSDGSRFGYSGNNIVTGVTNIDFEQAATRTVILRETHPDGNNSPKDTPITISVNNVKEVFLNALSLTGSSITENSASNVVVGGISGTSSGSTITLVSNDGGRFALSGTNIVTSTTNIDYEEGATRSITVRETHVDGANSPRETVLNISVNNVLERTLTALSLSNSSVDENSTAGFIIGSVSGKTVGSTLTMSNNDGGRFALSGTNVIVGATNIDFEQSPTRSISLTETHPDATNTPNVTTFTINVNNVKEVVLNTLTLSNSSIGSGSTAGAVVGTLVGTRNDSTVSLVNNSNGAFSLSGNSILVSGSPINSNDGLTRNIIVREVHPDAVGDSKDSAIAISVIPNLSALVLSANTVKEFANDGTVIGSFTNKTANSTLSLANSSGGKVAIVGSNLVVGSTDIAYALSPTFEVSVVETVSGYFNSPRTTNFTISVQELTFAPKQINATTATNITSESPAATEIASFSVIDGPYRPEFIGSANFEVVENVGSNALVAKLYDLDTSPAFFYGDIPDVISSSTPIGTEIGDIDLIGGPDRAVASNVNATVPTDILTTTDIITFP